MSDVKDELDLQRMWEETQIEYRELAGIKEGGLLEVLTVDDVLGRIAEEKANDEKAKVITWKDEGDYSKNVGMY